MHTVTGDKPALEKTTTATAPTAVKAFFTGVHPQIYHECLPLKPTPCTQIFTCAKKGMFSLLQL